VRKHEEPKSSLPGRLHPFAISQPEHAIHNLLLAKGALLAAAAATGLASVLSGLRLTPQAPKGATPIDSGASPAPEMSEEAAELLRLVNVLGDVNIGILGGVITVSTILSMKSKESLRWALASYPK
jgi:hypothetical protein